MAYRIDEGNKGQASLLILSPSGFLLLAFSIIAKILSAPNSWYIAFFSSSEALSGIPVYLGSSASTNSQN